MGLMNATTTTASTFDPETAWKQLLARDSSATFFYGVTTTGVVCRPGCSSRRPLRENVRFFDSLTEAARSGFRLCRRCKPASPQADIVRIVRCHLEQNLDRPVSLAELGTLAGASPFSVQRQFKTQMGVSPLQYQRALRAERMRASLRKGKDVTEAIYEAGYSSSSRAYEGHSLGMAPARFAAGGQGERIGFATAQSPFGWMIVGATERGLCWLALADTDAEAEQTLRREFPSGTIKRDPSLASLVDQALCSVREGSDLAAARNTEHALDLRGTVFQLRVWQALRAIPRGETRTYSQLAREMGDANATRAVARACATNRVAVLVPCHRVVGADGSLTGYRWGVERKRQLLEAERG